MIIIHILLSLFIVSHSKTTYEGVYFQYDSNYNDFYITFFSKENITNEYQILDKSMFDFKSCDGKEVKAQQIVEDNFNKIEGDCVYYFRVKYNKPLSCILIPNKIFENETYLIDINKALKGQKYCFGDKTIPDSLTQYIVLIEEVKNYNQNNFKQFDLSISIPMCNNKIFAEEDEDINIIINDNNYYTCKFSNIEEYNEINKIISCENNESYYSEIEKLYVNFTNHFSNRIHQIVFSNGNGCDEEEEEEEEEEKEEEEEEKEEEEEEEVEEVNEDFFVDINKNDTYIYYDYERNAIFNIYFKEENRNKINGIQFIGEIHGKKENISKFCVPSLSRFIHYAQFTCSLDIKNVFNIFKEDLINSEIMIYYTKGKSEIKYKNYTILRAMEQPFFKYYLNTINRTYIP